MADGKEWSGTLKLLLVTVFWGIGFPAMKIISESFPTFYQITLRFMIATAVLAILFHSRLKLINRDILKRSLILSTLLFACYIFATMGVEHTRPSRAAFLSCLSVLIIPVILRVASKTKVGARTLVSISVCAVGLFILSYSKEMGFYLNLGDILCLLCSAVSGLHIIMVGRLVKGSDPALIAFLQMAFVAVFSAITAPIVDPFPVHVSMNSIYALLFMGIFGTAVAFYLQASCQRYISATRTGIIFSLEPVNGAIASYLILGDSMGIQEVIGGALIFISLVYSETQKRKKVL